MQEDTSSKPEFNYTLNTTKLDAKSYNLVAVMKSRIIWYCKEVARNHTTFHVTCKLALK